MKILIDNGHGIQTKGKRSPDGKLLEYAYTRDLARQFVKILKSRGYDSELLVLCGAILGVKASYDIKFHKFEAELLKKADRHE